MTMEVRRRCSFSGCVWGHFGVILEVIGVVMEVRRRCNLGGYFESEHSGYGGAAEV